MTPCARDGCAADAGPLHSECLNHRIETAILERFIGGDSVHCLVDDFGPDVYTGRVGYRLFIERIIRDELARLRARKRKWRKGC